MADPPAPFYPGATRRVRPTVRVGVAVVVVIADEGDDDQQEKKLYCGFRKGSHGASKLALPGGHLEMNESWEECAVREIREEMGLSLLSSSDTNIEFLHVTNDIMKDDEKHYVTIFMVAKAPSGAIPENLEPEKCEGWDAYTLAQLTDMLGTETLFLPLEHMLSERPQKLLDMLQVHDE